MKSLKNSAMPQYGRFAGGAHVTKNKEVIFRLNTFDDINKVCVEIKPYDKRVFKIYPMEKIDTGVFELTANKKMAKNADRYRFILYKDEKPLRRVRDPYAMKRIDRSNWSIIYDQNLFKWNDKGWMNGEKQEKISSLANKENKLLPVSALRIYEANIPSLTVDGTCKAAIKKLIEIKNAGFNAIELMPVENSYGFNWGYDGADKFAPHHSYGSPDDLKNLINHAHKLKLNVITDMVPNHIGFDMFDIGNAGDYVDGCNEFGYKFNFEKHNNHVARTFIIGAALNWLINYHCDGLRLDLTKYMQSDFTMKQLAAEVQYHVPGAFLIAEDARENDPRVTRPFTSEEIYENMNNHSEFIDKIAQNSVSTENLGINSEWDFQFHKQIAASVLGYWGGFPFNIRTLEYVARNSGNRVKYPMSHDEIGNVDGTRLISKIFAKEINIYKNIPQGLKNQREQTFAHKAQNILVKLLSGKIEKMSNDEFKEFKKENFLDASVNSAMLKNAYGKALRKNRFTIAFTMCQPGPKMIFQRDEKGDVGYFKFFRELSCGYEKGLEAKGYPPGLAAFLDSKPGNIRYTSKFYRNCIFTAKMTKLLNRINDKNPALQSGNIDDTIVHDLSNVLAEKITFENNELFVISNISDDFYYENYKINFPEGVWIEIFNTDLKKIGGDGTFTNVHKMTSGENKISLPGYGVIVFKKL